MDLSMLDEPPPALVVANNAGGPAFEIFWIALLHCRSTQPEPFACALRVLLPGSGVLVLGKLVPYFWLGSCGCLRSSGSNANTSPL